MSMMISSKNAYAMQVPTDAPQLQHLLTLAALAREGSFSAAADSLGYTQSAVSQQIRRLEHAVGHILVERPGGRAGCG